MGTKWEQSGNKNPKVGKIMGTKWEQEPESGTRTPKWDKNGNKVGTYWEHSGNKNLKVGQDWEQSRSKLETRTRKWDKNGSKVGTRT